MGHWILGAITLAATMFSIDTTFAHDSEGSLVEICHYSEEERDWIKIRVSEEVARGHLRNHRDDAVPGGTSDFGTDLDEDCVEVVWEPHDNE